MASAGALATLALGRTQKGCRSTAGTTWRRSGTHRPWNSMIRAPRGPAPMALGSLAEPYTPTASRSGVGMRQGRRTSSPHSSMDAPRLHGLPALSRWFPQNLLPLTPHRDSTEQDVPDTVMLSPTQPKLDPSSLNEGRVVSVPPRPDLTPST